jgi:hypothetical protein
MPMLVCYGNRDGTFTSTELPSLAPWNFAVADYDRDGFLDFYCSYANVLFRNNGDRTFTSMTSEEVCSLFLSSFGGALWADYDDDGALDMYCASHGRAGSLYRNDGTGCFASIDSPVTQNTAIAGGWGDYDSDGQLDLAIASFGGSSFVYRNLGESLFEPAAIGQAISGNYNSAAWADYDNDGFTDLIFTGGYLHSNALYRNLGDGTFSRITVGGIVNNALIANGGTYGTLWFDYNNDGFLDIYITVGDDPGTVQTANLFYRNNGNGNSWLRLKLVGTVSNRDGVGAKVRVQARYAGQTRWQRRDISGGDIINGNHSIAHFGLGDATKAEVVRIEWPSGIVQELSQVPANQLLTVTEPTRLESLGEGRIRLWCWSRQNLVLEVSDDLDLWNSLGVVASDLNRPVVLDPEAANRPYRFYRARNP